MEKNIAHVKKNNNDQWETQSVNVHLMGTAHIAKSFAKEFNNEDWAELAGFWHDLGKYLPDWQMYLRRKTGFDVEAHIEIETGKGRPNHSTAGAVLALKRFKNPAIARILAYIIAGHHAGLPDWEPDYAGGDLINRLYCDPLNGTINQSELAQIKAVGESFEFIDKILPKSSPLGIKQPGDLDRNKEFFHLWIRMLFSCLVDADFLDTEKFMDSLKFSVRGNYPSLEILKTRFDTFMERKQKSVQLTELNRQRNAILETCRQKGKMAPGLYSLTVPTGGGKTLSSMAFALEHSLVHGKRRIIMAIPYTSIIEQTAKVYKYGTDDEEEIKKVIEKGEWLFGEEAVLEHHSNLDPEKEDHKSRLAAENWDAPIIVTTNVQLFESLYASRGSECRKLHNIVNSIIILDEAQMLPPEYLKPIVSVLKGLVEHFGVTVVLCTATQPALQGKIGSPPNIFEGLENVSSIIDNPIEMAESFKRVEVVVPSDLNVRAEWKDIAAELVKFNQVICIVNTRKDCRNLFSLMPHGTIHLSGLMCGEERSEIISDIKSMLRAGKPVCVISTQLVEAGVDIDFPVVYRALAGMDSIAQAAGRCNREGRLNTQGEMGRVVVFIPPKAAPIGLLRKGEDACKSLLRMHRNIDLNPGIFAEYFQHFYNSVNDFDKPSFSEKLVKESIEFKFQFRTFSMNFNLIDDTIQKGIIVRYRGKKRNSYDILEILREEGPNRYIIRNLQRFTVSIPVKDYNELFRKGLIEEINGYAVQLSDELYKPGIGLMYDAEADSASYVV